MIIDREERLIVIDTLASLYTPRSVEALKKRAEYFPSARAFLLSVTYTSNGRSNELKKALELAADAASMGSHKFEQEDNAHAFRMGTAIPLYGIKRVPTQEIKAEIADRANAVWRRSPRTKYYAGGEASTCITDFSDEAYIRLADVYRPTIELWQDETCKTFDQQMFFRRGVGFLLGVADLVRVDLIEDPETYNGIDWDSIDWQQGQTGSN